MNYTLMNFAVDDSSHFPFRVCTDNIENYRIMRAKSRRTLRASRRSSLNVHFTPL